MAKSKGKAKVKPFGAPVTVRRAVTRELTLEEAQKEGLVPEATAAPKSGKKPQEEVESDG